MVAPGRKELGGNLILGVPNNFPDEVELTLRDLVPDGRDVENLIRREAFVMRSSITSVMVILRIFLTFLWRKTSYFFNVASRRAQLSHPQRRRLQGIAQKIRYLESSSTALSCQKGLRAPIAAEAWEILASTS